MNCVGVRHVLHIYTKNNTSSSVYCTIHDGKNREEVRTTLRDARDTLLYLIHDLKLSKLARFPKPPWDLSDIFSIIIFLIITIGKVYCYHLIINILQDIPSMYHCNLEVCDSRTPPIMLEEQHLPTLLHSQERRGCFHQLWWCCVSLFCFACAISIDAERSYTHSANSLLHQI